MSEKLNPITRVELFLAKAAGAEVPALTPITRIERFLQNLIDHIKSIGTGGGGGATPDWNAAEGEPGHILNRTHYEYFAEVLPETAFEIDPEDGMGVIESVFTIDPDKQYRVTVNGETADAIVSMENGFPMLFLSVGGDYVGIVPGEYMMGDNTKMVIAVMEDLITGGTISVSAGEIRQIPDKYLPEHMQIYDIDITSDNVVSSINGVMTIDYSFDPFIIHLNSGGIVRIKTIAIDEDGRSIIQVSNITNYVWTYVDDGKGEGPVPVVFVDCPMFMGSGFSSGYGTLRFNGTISPPTT